MLRATVIGLQPAEGERVLIEDGPGKVSRRTACRHAAAPCPGINFHQHSEHDTGGPGGLRIGGHLRCIVGADRNAGAGGKLCQTPDLCLAHHLVGNKDV
jgi:hypothetical protein